jgi:DNA polymerase-3 subunit delta'
MDHLVLHDSTRSALKRLIAKPTHAVLITGPSGIGKRAIAEALAAAVLGVAPDRLASYPHYLAVEPDGASISIESIRGLQKFLQLKTTGSKAFRRAVIVEAAQALTTEAQNALLKLLEEPPADTIIILTASSSRALLPTILSRVQTLPVYTPHEAQLAPLFASSPKDEAARKQAYFLSAGLPGLLRALLDEGEHPMLASVTLAKEVLTNQPFERLALVDGLSKQKDATIGVVEALQRIAQAGIAGAANRTDSPQIKKWHMVRKQALQAREALGRNANAKLVLTDLFLNL